MPTFKFSSQSRLLSIICILIIPGLVSAQMMSFRSYYGPILAAKSGGGAELAGIANDIGSFETFWYEDVNGGILMSGDLIYLRSMSSNKYVSVRFDMSNQPVMVNGGGPWAWEGLRIYSTSGGQIVTGSEVYLTAMNGNVLSVRFDVQGQPVRANVTWVGAYEKLRVQIVPKGYTLFQWCNGARTYKSDTPLSPDYVTVVDLTRAKVVSLAGSDMGNGVSRESHDNYWASARRLGNPYALINGTYFDGEIGIATFSFGLKQTYKTYFNTANWPNARVLCLGGTQAWSEDSISNAHSNPNAKIGIGVLTTATPSSEKENIGRTIVGIGDAFGEGRNQHLYIYSSDFSRKETGMNVLSLFGGRSQFLFDSGRSTYLGVWGTRYVLGTRYSWIPPRDKLPNMIAIFPN